MKYTIKDITGKRFGKLVAVSFAYSKNGSYWNCICDCGNTTIVYLGKLTTGATKSCGCISKRSLGMYKTRLYCCYKSMMGRCNNKNDHAYKNYGGKGISVCDEWNGNFVEFYNWATKNGYNDNLTIDRIDSNLGYCPENCRWITKSENTARSNKSNPRNLSKYTYIITNSNGFYIETNNIAKFVRENINANERAISGYIRSAMKKNDSLTYNGYNIKKKG